MKKLFTKTSFIIIVFCAFSINTYSQGVIISTDPLNVGYTGRTYHNIEGSPYLYENWIKGSVKLTNGLAYSNLSLKYDQVADELIFLNETSKPQIFQHPVHEFTILNNQNREIKFRNGFTPVEDGSAMSFYEVLADGNTQLLKRTSKSIVEELASGSNILKVQKIKENTKYYIATADKLIRIKKDQKSILSALSGKSTELSKFIKDNKLNLKADDNLAKVIAYYNSI